MKHCGLGDLNIDITKTTLLPFTLKRIVRQKERFWKLKHFTMQKYNLQKSSKKKKKNKKN